MSEQKKKSLLELAKESETALGKNLLSRLNESKEIASGLWPDASAEDQDWLATQLM